MRQNPQRLNDECSVGYMTENIRVIKIPPARDCFDHLRLDGQVVANRIETWQNTLELAQNKFQRFEPSVKLSCSDVCYHQRISVVNQDTVDAGIELKKQGLNPVLLNFSDDVFAGGYVGHGSGAQEESIFRRSNYHLTLLQDFYPLSDTELVYSPEVTIFKESEANKWKVMDDPVTLTSIACPAIKRPQATNDRLNADDTARFVKKIEMILRTALRYNHDSIVLGAFGCGAWGNPPQHVAEIFKHVITTTFPDAFKEIVFAIIDLPNTSYKRSRYPNSLEIFRTVFTDANHTTDSLPISGDNLESQTH